MKLFKGFLRIPFVNASLYSALSTFIKVFCSLILGKIIAVKLGAVGMVYYGQLLSFSLIVFTLAGNSYSQGIIKIIAQLKAKADEENYNSFLVSSRSLVLISSGLVSVGLLIFSVPISRLVFNTDLYYKLFIVFGVTIFSFSLNGYYIAITNGLKDFRRNNFLNIFLNIYALVFSLILIHFYDSDGAFYSIVLNQFLFLFILLYLIRNEDWFRISIFNFSIKKKYTNELLGFSLLALTSTCLTPVVAILIRKNIISILSEKMGGYYELVSRISGASIMFFTLSISTYFIPRIAEINLRKDLKKEVNTVLKIVVPIAISILVLLYLVRSWVINLLASPDFAVSESLFKYQLLGDFCKIISIIIGFQFVAKGLVKLSICVEVFFNISFLLLSYIFMTYYGIEGVSMAYFFSYLSYFIVLFLINKKFVIPRYYEN